MRRAWTIEIAILIFLAAIAITLAQSTVVEEINRSYSHPPAWTLEREQTCPVCKSEGVYRGGVVVWEFESEAYISTKADRLPVFWCTECGNLFSRKAERRPE